MEVIEEVKVNGNNNDELKANGIAEAESESPSGNSPRGSATLEVKEAKLIEFSPQSTPSHEPKPPIVAPSNDSKPESPERKRSVSECNTSSTEKDSQQKTSEVDTVSQTSVAEDEDGTGSVTSAKDEVDR